VAKKKENGPRKRRTRGHVIADLAVNHVQRYVLRYGFTMEHIRNDYGLDIAMFTYSRGGEIENGVIWSQVKATDRPQRLADGLAIAVRVERRDLVSWVGELHPVILILYDAREDKAYWLHVQSEWGEGRIFRLAHAGTTVTVHIPRAHVFNEAAVRQLRRLKLAAAAAAIRRGPDHA
jgi:hypothetical protein